MTMTWPRAAETKTAPGLRARLLSLSAAGVLCTGLTYLAVTQQFGVLSAVFEDVGAVEVVVEPPAPPEPPPPVVRNDPPPQIQQQQIAIDLIAPPVRTPLIISDPDPAPPAPSPALTNATFLERPDGRDFARYYPGNALRRGVGGRVVLDCSVAASGRLNCSVASEEPAGWGFGDASLRAAQHFRVAPATADGQATSGGRLRVPMTWRTR